MKKRVLARLENSALPDPSYSRISDNQFQDSIETNQLRLQRERGADMIPFSPWASAMGHHLGGKHTSPDWSRTYIDLIKRVVDLYHTNFSPVFRLPQSEGVSLDSSVEELERCVNELGFVDCNFDPVPSGGHWKSRSLTDRCRYPMYERIVELDMPAMIHVSASCNLNFHATDTHYINVDTTSYIQFIQGDLFMDFPDIRFVTPHGEALCHINGDGTEDW